MNTPTYTEWEPGPSEIQKRADKKARRLITRISLALILLLAITYML